MPRLTCTIPDAVMDELIARSEHTGETIDSITAHALADALGLEHAALFQVSAAGALMAGVTRGTMTVAELLQHGDFGLGTFDDLDGEMVVLDGTAYQVTNNGVEVADDRAHVPYAVVTNFHPDDGGRIDGVESFADLTARLDRSRTTDNEFFAVRLEGSFQHVKARAVCRTDGTTTLSDAAATQAEFEFEDIDGVIVGFWSPEYTTSITVAEWHLHVLDRERRQGGHLLDCRSLRLDLQMQRVADFHMAFPETADFLRADLSEDFRDQLAAIETDRAT